MDNEIWVSFNSHVLKHSFWFSLQPFKKGQTILSFFSSGLPWFSNSWFLASQQCWASNFSFLSQPCPTLHWKQSNMILMIRMKLPQPRPIKKVRERTLIYKTTYICRWTICRRGRVIVPNPWFNYRVMFIHPCLQIFITTSGLLI